MTCFPLPVHARRERFRPEQSIVTLFGGHSPLQINDHASRSAEQALLQELYGSPFQTPKEG